MTKEKSYWGYAFFILIFSAVFFILAKNNLPDKLFVEIEKTDSEHIVTDELMKEAMNQSAADSIEGGKKEIDSIKAVKDSLDKLHHPPDPVLPSVLNEGHSAPSANEFLNNFYSRLAYLEQNPKAAKVRIAYFGDSMTDGDLIVQDIRQLFQDKYGGGGVGFVPLISESARSRISVIHRFSPNWKTYSYMKRHEWTPPFGVNGQVFYSVDSLQPNYVHIRSGQNRKNRLLPQPELYYGGASNDSAFVKVVIHEDSLNLPLKAKQTVNRLELSPDRVDDLKLFFHHSDSIPFYGINMDLSYGVQIDNFSNRGNSGLPLSQLKPDLIQAFKNSGLQYDLLILHYGTNVLSSESKAYGWYGQGMNRVVQHLKNAFPGTSILIISIADRAQKYDTEMQTDSAVNPLLQAQKSYATQQKVGFINLYELMGGRGSMIKWVEDEEPPKGNKDYTHFSPYGARKVARLLFGEMEKGFDNYKGEKQRILDSLATEKAEEERRANEINSDSL